MTSDKLLHKGLNVFLRGFSLAGKMALTLYMGRYLGLEGLGLYGLVFSAVIITSNLLGARIDFVIARELVGCAPTEATRKMRDQSVFCLFNYFLLFLIILFLFALKIASPFILFSIFILAVLENACNMATANLIALQHPMASTFFFFIRAGLWAIIISVLGIFFPSLRHVEYVLLFWMGGAAASLLFIFFFWRHLPWLEIFRIPVNWQGIKTALHGSFPIWIGTLGGAAANYIDRFVVSYFLDLEQVGIITFFASFASALLALVDSGFFSFTFPRLVKYHRAGKTEAFWDEVRQINIQIALFAFFACVAIGVCVPLLGQYLGRPALSEEAPTLWLLLGAIWIRCLSETYYYVLYARKQDWANWVGGVVFLIPSFGFNALFVPFFGLEGAGVSAIVSALLLLAWRLYFVRYPEKNIYETKGA